MEDGISDYQYLRNMQIRIANTAAMIVHYKKWSREFAQEELNKHCNVIDEVDNEPRYITINNIADFSVEQKRSLGICLWDEQEMLWLLPLWMYNFVADGEELTSIDDEVSVKGKDNIDLDTRFGCIAYGFKV